MHELVVLGNETPRGYDSILVSTLSRTLRPKALGLAAAHTRAVDYLAAPNARDWANVRCLMGKGKAFDPATKWYTSPFGVTTSPVLVGDEYGIVGSTVQWSLQAELWLAKDAVDGPGLPRWTGDADVLQLTEPVEEGREIFPADVCSR